MTKPYFRQVPNFEYVSRNPGDKYISEYIPVKNLFKRGKIREDIFGNLQFFEKYGSYDNLYNGIHHYETEEIKNSLGITVLKGGIHISPTWKTNGNFIETINSRIADISAENYDYETLQIVPTNVVTVSMVNGLLGVNVGDQIIVDNVPESQYNGKHVITEIVSKINNLVFTFKYELPFIPNVTKPILANPRKEQVIFTIPEKSISDDTGESIVFDSDARYYEYWDDGLGYSVLVPSTSFVKTVSNYEYEKNIEEGKRNVYVLKPKYLNVIFNDMDDIMPYKKGSQQYVTENLKRADNARLYE